MNYGPYILSSYTLDGEGKGPAPDDDGEGTYWYEVIDPINLWSFSENLESWVIDTEPPGANRMNLALGLPIVNTTSDTTYTFEIGPTNGITSDQLHDDEWIFNTGDHLNKASGADFETHEGVPAAVVSGGGLKMVVVRVRFMELIEQEFGKRVDIGFRCVMKIEEPNDLDTQSGTRAGNQGSDIE